MTRGQKAHCQRPDKPPIDEVLISDYLASELGIVILDPLSFDEDVVRYSALALEISIRGSRSLG